MAKRQRPHFFLLLQISRYFFFVLGPLWPGKVFETCEVQCLALLGFIAQLLPVNELGYSRHHKYLWCQSEQVLFQCVFRIIKLPRPLMARAAFSTALAEGQLTNKAHIIFHFNVHFSLLAFVFPLSFYELEWAWCSKPIRVPSFRHP